MSALPLIIGAVRGDEYVGGGVGSFFTGTIDEVEIYNRGLSTTEIQAIFNAGTAGKCKP